MTNRIDQALRGLISPDELDGDEQELFFDRFAEMMAVPSGAEEAFWAERERLGLGVGLDEDDNLVYPAVKMPPSTQTLQ